MAKRILPVDARSGQVNYAQVTRVRANRAAARAKPKMRVFSRSSIIAGIAMLGFAVGITPIASPELHSDHQTSLDVTFASLSFSGTDPVITGSVNQLFQSPSFVGPTSAQKTERQLPRIDVLEFAASFAQQRIHVAALRAGPMDPALPQSRAAAVIDTTELDEAPRISLALIDPALASAALLAIGAATPIDPSIPLPIFASEQLAYSRANTPTTEHAVNLYSERERWCLATGIYFEARGESYRGQVGVAQVIMNRVKHRLYPDTICGVVFQNQSWRNRCQFSFACDGIPERVNDSASWAKAREITTKVTNGSLYLTEVANATHYHANYVYPHWAPRMTRLTRIGQHIFYRFRRS